MIVPPAKAPPGEPPTQKKMPTKTRIGISTRARKTTVRRSPDDIDTAPPQNDPEPATNSHQRQQQHHLDIVSIAGKPSRPPSPHYPDPSTRDSLPPAAVLAQDRAYRRRPPNWP